MKHNLKKLLAGAAVALILSLYCVYSLAASSGKTPLATFSTQLLDGTPIDGSVFQKHSVTVVNLWATWCGPCLSEMPDFQECYVNNSNNEGSVGIYGLLHQDNVSTVSAAVATMGDKGWSYPCILQDGVWLEQTYKYTSIPQTFFIDSNGNVLEVKSGAYRSAGEIQARIDYWLSQAGGNGETADTSRQPQAPTQAPGQSNGTERGGGIDLKTVLICAGAIAGLCVILAVVIMLVKRNGK